MRPKSKQLRRKSEKGTKTEKICSVLIKSGLKAGFIFDRTKFKQNQEILRKMRLERSSFSFCVWIGAKTKGN